MRRSEDWLIEAHGRRLARECRVTLHHMSAAIQGISGQIDRPPADVLPGIAIRASELAGYTIEHPCRGFAPAGVVSAFYFFLHFRGDYEAALEEAINWGGDADTVGAILGAMCGAQHGLAAIPARWTDPLRGRDLVVSRARALAGDKTARDAMPNLPDSELAWTQEEDRIRRERTGQPPVEAATGCAPSSCGRSHRRRRGRMPSATVTRRRGPAGEDSGRGGHSASRPRHRDDRGGSGFQRRSGSDSNGDRSSAGPRRGGNRRRD